MKTSFLLLLMTAFSATACGGGDDKNGDGNGTETGDTSLHLYPPMDPSIQYVGRVSYAYPASPEYSSPAVTVRLRFKGNGIALDFADGATGQNPNYFDVVLDGEALPKLEPIPNLERYEIATGLPYGEHELSFVKRTEASIGRTLFTGVEVNGVLIDPPAPREHKMEIIGDSISCGAGAFGTTTAECAEGGWGVPYNDARIAFGSLVAENLGADYHVTAVSGIGLVRNYSDMYDARPMPEVYDSLFLQNRTSPAIDPSEFPPDAILIVLGTNDFSPGDNPPDMPRESMDVNDYADAYIAFVDTLLSDAYYPNAQIFTLSSPMLSDGWPNATDTFATDLKDALDLVEAHYLDAGETRVHKFFVSKLNGAGCGTHPSADQHAELAAELEPFVRETMGW